MGEFIITAPDGKKYKVTGDSAEGAVAALGQMLGVSAEDDANSETTRIKDVMAQRSAQNGGLQGAIDRAAPLNKQAEQAIRDPGALASAAIGATQGATLNFGDEIMGGLAAGGGAIGDALSGNFSGMGDRMASRYSGTKQAAVDLYDAAKFSRPKTTVGGEIAGGIVGSIPMAAAAAPAVAAAAPTSLAAKVLAGAGAGAVTGGTYGAVAGAGRGEGAGRIDTALQDAAMGTVFGGALGAAAPVVSEGVRGLANWVKGQDYRRIAQTLGISNDAAKALLPDLEALDFPAARAAIKTAGPDAMLADAGISTRQALDSAITGGGKGAQTGVTAISERAAAAGAKLNRVMDAVLGVPEGVKSVAKGIAARTAPMRQRAYNAAYSSAINYADDAGRNIEAVLARIPSKTMQTAINEANDAMKAAGIKNMQIMADIAKDGTVTFREMPNVQQLDEIKKALGVVGSELDALGRPTATANRANGLARDLRDAVGEAVPAYRMAVKLGGDKIAEDKALDMGRRIFTPSVSREMVRETMDGASIEAQDAARRGVREYLDAALARVRNNIDDPSIDTQETRRLLDTLSTRDAREKLVAILGKPKADRLFSEIDMVGKQFATRQAVATGSQTGMREARSRAIDTVLAPGVVQSAAQGRPIESLRSFVQMVTRETPTARNSQRQEVLSQIAAALTKMRGPQVDAALTLIEKAIAGQPLRSAEAALLGRVAAEAGVLGGYQTSRLLPQSK